MFFEELYEEKEVEILGKLFNQNDFRLINDELEGFIRKFLDSQPEETRVSLNTEYDQIIVNYTTIIQKFVYSLGVADGLMLLQQNKKSSAEHDLPSKTFKKMKCL